MEISNNGYLLFFVSMGLHIVSSAVLKAIKDLRSRGVSSRRYFKSMNGAQDHYYRATTDTRGVKTQQSNTLRAFAYGLYVYVPPSNTAVIDFGKSAWPPKYSKPINCPRLLMVYQWSGSKISMPGGKSKNRESALDCVNREFEEEVGSQVPFVEGDYSFSTVDAANNNKVTHLFAKVTNSLAEFDQLVNDSSSSKFSNRRAYIEEIFGVLSHPLWIEGPEDSHKAVMWGEDMTHGIPRLISGFKDPEVILLLLHRTGVISLGLLQRIFDLADALNSSFLQKLSPLQCLCYWLNSKVNPKWDNFFTFKEFQSCAGVPELLLNQDI